MKCVVDFTPIQKIMRNPKKVPSEVLDVLQGWAQQVQMYGIENLKKVRRYWDHPLKGDRKGQRAISLSYQWRAIYTENNYGEIKIICIEEVVPHDY